MKKDAFVASKFKTKKPYSERKATFLVLLITLLAIAFFWSEANITNLWQKLKTPASFEIFYQKNKNKDEILGEIKNLTKDLMGSYSVYVYSFGAGREYGIDEDKVFIAASLNKIPIMLKAYQMIEEEKLSLNDKYELKKEDIQDYGTGSMRYEEIGKEYTYNQLLVLTGKESDNTAAHVLGKIIGLEEVQSLLGELGLEKISMEKNETTPRQLGQLFIKAWKGEVLKKEEIKKRFFDNLTRTDFEDRISLGIPSGVRIAHKVGSADRAYHDCGLVFGQNNFVLCIFSSEASEEEALGVMPKIAKVVWEFEEN